MFEANDAQARAVTGVLADVASAGGTEALSQADRHAIAGAWHTVLGRTERLDQDPAPPRLEEAAEVLDSAELRTLVVRLAAVMAFVDGRVDNAKLERVLAWADALDIEADFVHGVHAMLDGDVSWVAADQIRHNVATIPGMPWNPDAPYGEFLPYRDGRTDPELHARYEALADLPQDTLGAAFHEHYRRNGFAFPGAEDAVAEVWATPHDTLHLLSGYSTSAQGEILVAAFTVGQLRHNDDPMESHVLPTILIYHLGLDINKGLNKGDRERIAADPDWAKTYTGTIHLGLDAAKLWVAWDRGRAMTEDVYSGVWDFWEHVTTPLQELRQRYGVPPLDPADAALDDDEIDATNLVQPGEPLPPRPGSVRNQVTASNDTPANT